jgi:hypothetical protein
MKMKLLIEKHGTRLYDGTYDISDAESFGDACMDAFEQLCQRRMGKATSIGEVFEDISSYALNDLEDARISLTKA